MSKKQTSRRDVLWTLAVYSSPLWTWPAGWLLAYHPWPVVGYIGVFLLTFDLMTVLGLIVGTVVLIVAPFVALFESYRRRALIAMGLALVFVSSTAGGIALGQVVWRTQVYRVIDDAEPLVMAIHSFEQKNGLPPRELGELVPQDFAAVPKTGIGISKNFKYSVNELVYAHGNNAWELIIYPPCLPMGFDLILYFPQQNYPDSGYGGGIERIGKWGYVHE